jgi:hypothetical protein
VALALAGWLVPGAAHVLVGDIRRAVIFFVVLVAMFTIGVASGGRLFPFQLNDLLVFLEALAEWFLGLPRIVAGLGGYGQGEIVVSTYEYGNTFLIAAGLLNALVVLDAIDVASGRKRR